MSFYFYCGIESDGPLFAELHSDYHSQYLSVCSLLLTVADTVPILFLVYQQPVSRKKYMHLLIVPLMLENNNG